MPISASRKENLDGLEGVIESLLPVSPFYFPPEEVTDRSEKFLVAELIREKLMRQFGEELPYATTIQLERFEAQSKVIQIDATIFVERTGQRAILIGAGGNKPKRVGIDARKDIEKLLDHQVMLRLWVKVKRGWSDDERHFGAWAMARINWSLLEGYILHQRPYRESSVIAEFFSRDEGRIPLLLNGIRGKNSRRSAGGLIQPFDHLAISVAPRGI